MNNFRFSLPFHQYQPYASPAGDDVYVFYIYETRMKMAVLPTKSLEHEEVRWFDKLPDRTDPRLKDLI